MAPICVFTSAHPPLPARHTECDGYVALSRLVAFVLLALVTLCAPLHAQIAEDAVAEEDRSSTKELEEFIRKHQPNLLHFTPRSGRRPAEIGMVIGEVAGKQYVLSNAAANPGGADFEQWEVRAHESVEIPMTARFSFTLRFVTTNAIGDGEMSSDFQNQTRAKSDTDRVPKEHRVWVIEDFDGGVYPVGISPAEVQEGSVFYGMTPDKEGHTKWQQHRVRVIRNGPRGQYFNLTDDATPPFLFDATGNLVALRGYSGIAGENGSLWYVLAVDNLLAFADLGAKPSDAVRALARKREIDRYDATRPIRNDKLFVTWSDEHDELKGFSRRTGELSKLSIEPQDIITPVLGANFAFVQLDDRVCAFSAETASWDVLLLEATPDKPVVPVITNAGIEIHRSPHFYEFTPVTGRWISPTDEDIDSIRPLAGEQAAGPIPPGYRVITLPFAGEQLEFESLRPGFMVDLVKSPSEVDRLTQDTRNQWNIVVENVPVFAIDSETRVGDSSGMTRPRNLSLLVTMPQRGLITKAQQAGTVSVAIRGSSTQLSNSNGKPIAGLPGEARALDELQQQASRQTDPLSSPKPLPSTAEISALTSQLQAVEQASLRAAVELRNLESGDRATPQAVAALESSLKSKVAEAFQLRWKLQDVRLKQTRAELEQLEAVHQKRKRLAEKIVERRIEALREGDDLSWMQSSRETNSGSSARISGNGAPVHDSELSGEWKLVSSTGSASLTLKPNSRLTIANGRWQIRYFGQARGHRVIINAEANPRQIDLAGESAFSDTLSGIYKIDQDVLTVAWAAADGAGTRPTDFAGTDSNLQIWKRIEPLPVFATPEELLSYHDTVTRTSPPDMEKYVRLLTDDEAQRFTGAMIAATGMLNRMAPVLMLAAQFPEHNPEITTELAAFAEISALLRDAVSSSASLQSVQAFEELTRPEALHLTGQLVSQPIDVDTFSEKLKLAGGAVADPLSFTIQMVQLLEALDDDASTDMKKQDSPKPVWAIARDGDKAIAVNQARSKSRIDMASNTLELVQRNGTWKISKIMDDADLLTLARSVNTPLVGTDQDGKQIPLNSIFQPIVMEDGSVNPDVPAEHLTLEQALERQAFCEVDLVTRQTPNGLAYTLEGDGAFAEYLPDYLDVAYERLLEQETWEQVDLSLLRSIDPAIQFAKVGNTWNLQRFGDLALKFVNEHAASDTSRWQPQNCPWSSAMLTRIVKTQGKLPEVILTARHSDPAVRKRLDLLETMVKNSAGIQWMEQERIRLVGLLIDAPVETIRLLVEHAAADDSFGYKRWLFMLSREEFYPKLKTQPNLCCGQPVDVVLLVHILAQLAGRSKEIDDRMALILDPRPSTQKTGSSGGASLTFGYPGPASTPEQNSYITRQLHDLLSNDYAYRQFVIDALLDLYVRSKSDELRNNIATVAPGVRIQANAISKVGSAE